VEIIGAFAMTQPLLWRNISVHTGNPFGGLTYTLAVVAIALVVGLIWPGDTRTADWGLIAPTRAFMYAALKRPIVCGLSRRSGTCKGDS
jgi:hypothetical protein